jgi:predicted transcriptional regulator/DNA-binding XRE family transcriptional regulator
MSFDPAVFGHRLRHHRRARDLTLERLGELIDRPAPYLSLLENGKREPKLSQIAALADVLGVTTDDLLDPSPPNRRAELELELDKIRQDPRYQAFGLGELKASAKVPDEALEHVVAFFRAATDRDTDGSVDAVRLAAAEVSRWLSEKDGYLEHVERAAVRALAASGHEDVGALTSRHLNAIVTRVGYTVDAVDDVPVHIRSIVDEDRGIIYVGQRNSLRTRQARKAILQSIAGRVMGHTPPATAFDRQRQRLEEAYFAAAVLVPERAAAAAITTAKKERDLSIEDIKERFYVSYEMAAIRFTNLATRHLGIPTHFIHSDRDGMVWKAYQNDGFPIPTLGGAAEGRRLCRHFGARTVYDSPDRFNIHYQFTDTPDGSYWSATHLTPDESARALSTGVRYADARWFRGRRTPHQEKSRCPDDTCCRTPDGPAPRVRAGQRLQAHLVTLLSGDTPPPIDLAELADFLGRHAKQERSSESEDLAYADPWADTREDVP